MPSCRFTAVAACFRLKDAEQWQADPRARTDGSCPTNLHSKSGSMGFVVGVASSLTMLHSILCWLGDHC